MTPFYSRLSYSFGNEDWKTEQKALQIDSKSDILCITASGDRPLNLLTRGCSSLVSVDANPFQNALFELKKTALFHLSFSEYLAFLGADHHPNRLQVYDRLDKYLSAPSSSIWKKNRSTLKKGVLYQGALEKCLKLASQALQWLSGKKINKLCSFDNLEEQQHFLKTEWNSALWERGIQLILHPSLSRLFIKDPGLYAHVDPSMHIGKYIYNKLHEGLNRCLAKESALISLLFTGRVSSDYFPPYLQEEGVKNIKKNTENISHQTNDLISFLKQDSGTTYNRFSISDVASYLSQSDFELLIENIFKRAKPHSRFCIRQFLSNYSIPERLVPYFKRDFSLEQQLEKEDRCFCYRFMVGEILKN